MKQEKIYHISVNCEKNDRVDIRCGGPEWLGFDFYVDSKENILDFVKFIEAELKKNNKPCISILFNMIPYNKHKIWKKRSIAKEIKNYSL